MAIKYHDNLTVAREWLNGHYRRLYDLDTWKEYEDQEVRSLAKTIHQAQMEMLAMVAQACREEELLYVAKALEAAHEKLSTGFKYTVPGK